MKLASVNNACRDTKYRNRFIKILDGKKAMWNWSAFLFSYSWMYYRKMYQACFFVCGSIVASALGVGYLGQLIEADNIIASRMIFAYLLVWISVWILIGIFGNYWYYKTLKTKISKGYHLTDNVKNVDKISTCLSILFVPLAFMSGAIIAIRDHRKVRAVITLNI